MNKLTIILFLHSVFFSSYGQVDMPWKGSSPEEQRMNSLTLINGIDKLISEGAGIHSLVIIRDGYRVTDACFYPFRKNYVHDLASVTKSITSLLIGIAIDKGFIESEDEPAVKYFPEQNLKSDTLRALRIKDLLNMASGLRCSWNDGEKELREMSRREDWTDYMFNLPFEAMPGERFAYCSGNFYLLAAILQRATKMSCYDFAVKYLFQPLNIDKTYWLKNHKNVNNGWGDLYMSTYDLAKIGCLVLDSGKWTDHQVISREWMAKIRPQYKINDREYYGYGWWHDRENPYEIQAIGRGGQRLFVLRDKHIVIATTGGGFDAGDLDDLIMESMNSYIESANHASQLIVKTESWCSPPPASKSNAGFLPEILNKNYHIGASEIGITRLRFEQKNDVYSILLDFSDGSNEKHPFGLNNQYIISNERTLGLPIGVKGFWDNDTLVIDYNEFSRINRYQFKFTFLENGVDFDFQDQTNNRNLQLRGILEK